MANCVKNWKNDENFQKTFLKLKKGPKSLKQTN